METANAHEDTIGIATNVVASADQHLKKQHSLQVERVFNPYRQAMLEEPTDDNLRCNEKLAKFFEILMRIDQRQKRNGKDN